MIYWAIQTIDLEHQINSMSINVVLIASLILIGATIIAALLKDHYPKLKLPLFVLMAATLIISTSFLLGSTVYLNVKSESKGPVHWHSDIEFWACGAELELRNPTGKLSNKIGTATYHEHNDKRIHLEGVVVKKAEDASLGKFMRVTGGDISDDRIQIPINEDPGEWFASEDSDKLDGDRQPPADPGNYSQFVKMTEKGPVMELADGQRCGEQAAELQVFVYSFNKGENTYTQAKLADPAEYVLRDESVVPPADCVIVEFDQPKDVTDKLCRQYGVRDELRCTEFGVKQYNPELCNIRQVFEAGGNE
jgi:hypothetical protein